MIAVQMAGPSTLSISIVIHRFHAQALVIVRDGAYILGHLPRLHLFSRTLAGVCRVAVGSPAPE
jgi:hypothetical protein